MAESNGKTTKKLIIYLDASVLISFTEAESDEISELLSTCKKKGFEIRVTPFTIMEALGIKQEHKFFMKKVSEGIPMKWIISKRRERDLENNDLREIYNILKRKLKPYDMENFYYIEDKNWWKLALDITRDSNVNSSDAIHLAQAVFMGCDILVTTDSHFIQEGIKYIKEYLKNEDLILCLPKQAIAKIKDN